jgi:hypothetical protein
MVHDLPYSSARNRRSCALGLRGELIWGKPIPSAERFAGPLVGGAGACHKAPMNTETTYPYSLEVSPCERPAGHFHWAIRKRGKLIQRSDRAHPSEDKTREKGQAELERLFYGGQDRR